MNMIGEGRQTAHDARRILNKRGQRGSSLIEILMVLVVLLIGIFLAIRVFPVGFGVLRANGNRSIATRMAEQQMGQLRSDVSNLPQGVLFAYPGANGLATQTEIDPDNLQQFDTDGDPDSVEPFNPYFSDVNKFRYIKGERLKVPLPTTMDNGAGAIYVCKFGPILLDPKVGDPEAIPTTVDEKKLFDSYLAVYGAPMTRVNTEAPPPNANANGPLNPAPPGFFRTQQTYLIDYGEDAGEPAQIAFAPRSDNANRTNNTRNFRITLTYDSGAGLVTNTITMAVTDAQAGKWMPLNVNDVVPGSETVAREFDRVAASGTWDQTDPYQYKLISPNVTTGDANTFGNIGVLHFNPAGGNYTEQVSGNLQPFVAYLDYAVLDWHIIKEDREVPSVLVAGGNTIPVRLVLNNLKRIGDSETDNTFYNGLFNDENNKIDIQVFNLNDPTGVALVAGTYNRGNPQDVDPYTGNALPGVADYYIETDEKGGTYRTGTIYLNSARVPAGSKLRILYKAQGDWAVAFQKAYSNYDLGRLQTGAPAAFPKTGRVDAFGISGVGAAAEMRFPLADQGKAFVVTLEYPLQSGEIKRLAPIQMTTENEIGNEPNPPTDYDGKYAVVNVSRFLPAALQAEFANAGTNWTVVGCQGISVKSRVIWRETDSNRWKVQDMDSYLTPKTSEAQ